jgi:argininosuccinate lyase
MAKLWQKDTGIDSLLEEFTVGRDYLLDRELGAADCAGSVAHARMLRRQGLISDGDLGQLEPALRDIATAFLNREVDIDRGDEDCHTAIENRLVKAVGDAGKRIHLGRSRNDQVMTMLRLYGREYLLDIRDAVLVLVETLASFAGIHEKTPCPAALICRLPCPPPWASGPPVGRKTCLIPTAC